MGHRSQHRSDRLLLVPPPHRGSTIAVSQEPPATVRLGKSRTNERATLSQTPVVVVVVVDDDFMSVCMSTTLH